MTLVAKAMVPAAATVMGGVPPLQMFTGACAEAKRRTPARPGPVPVLTKRLMRGPVRELPMVSGMPAEGPPAVKARGLGEPSHKEKLELASRLMESRCAKGTALLGVLT
jgi:hypothetical protein